VKRHADGPTERELMTVFLAALAVLALAFLAGCSPC